jgi:CHAT domain-containing protein
MIWDPIAPVIADASRILIVPDGQLNLVNFAALPTKNGHYLVEQDGRFEYLAAERDLRGTSARSGARRAILVVGGVDFDSSTARGAWVADHLRGVGNRTSRCAAFQRLQFASLPGSRVEANSVAEQEKRFATAVSGRQDSIPQCVELQSTAATEGEFKRLAPQCRYLHVATHGFFLADECQDTTSSRATAGISNPMLMSGLAFAGANRQAVGADGEDGILTAEEVTTLHLEGAELVVLSACNSGVGELAAGEGVRGLRRAFELAGAQHLVLSLWKVEDTSTVQWMHGFYDRLWAGRSGIAEAARATSLDLLRAQRRKGLGTHPAQWGAFIASGLN